MIKNQRIAIIGPESSGKTTLANTLGKKLNWPIIGEYAREYFNNKNYSKCKIIDLINIAEKQFASTHSIPLQNPIISDTEIITIDIWAEDKYNHIPSRITELRKAQKFDLFILSLPDIKWQYDALRTDADRREIILEKYKNFLRLNQLNYIVAQGDVNNRVNICLEYLKNI